jgi:FeS assembly protein IscX
MDKTLTWEDSYAIALTLVQRYPDKNLEEVSLGMVYQWVISLPGFADDPMLANDEILAAIYLAWIEEDYTS